MRTNFSFFVIQGKVRINYNKDIFINYGKENIFESNRSITNSKQNK
jgi:hypothetical protein